jgi:hypothetical protein
MPFRRGISGNLAGPAPDKTPVAQVRKTIEADFNQILKSVINAAFFGDMAAARAALLGLALASSLLAFADPGSADFAEFLARFRAALARPDAASVADLTRLPFLFEGEHRDRAAFERIVPVVFDAQTRACIAQAKPIVEDDAQVIFCDPYAFYFRHGTGGSWQLEEFAADGEALP